MPNLRVFKPAYLSQSLSSKNTEGYSRKGIQAKIPWVAWLTGCAYSRQSVWLLLVVIQ